MKNEMATRVLLLCLLLGSLGTTLEACTFDDQWWPYWSGQSSLPPAKVRVLANDQIVASFNLCFNPLWVELGELRRQVGLSVDNGLQNVGFFVWNTYAAGVTEVPLETLLFSMEFQSGDVELFVLTHDLAGSVRLCCPDVQADFTMPTIFSDGILKPLEGRIDAWKVEFPKADIDLDVNLSTGLLIDFFEGFIETVFDGVVEDVAFSKVQEKLEALDPNDLLGSFLGPSATILQAINDAADFLEIQLPSPPSGTRFTLFIRNPAPGGSNGEITIALVTP